MARNFNPKYKVNLIDVFNRAFSDKPAQVRDQLRRFIREPSIKQAFGSTVIREIQNRTQNKRIDKKNRPLKAPYSKAYQESLEFKVYGKTPGKVDLTQTGEMLASMRPISKLSGFTVTIEFVDQANRNKAQGHISGKLGRVKRRFKRDFFGLPEDEEEKILRKIVTDASQQNIIATIETLAGDLQVGGQVGAQEVLLSSELFGGEDES